MYSASKLFYNFVFKPIAFTVVLIVLWILYIEITTFNNALNPDQLDTSKKLVWKEEWKYTKVPIKGGTENLSVLERESKIKDEKEGEISGTPSSPPLLILLHGYPESAWLTWNEVIPFLSSSFHIIAPDQRGYNNSYSPSSVSEYGLEHLVDDVLQVINHFKKTEDQKVYVAAHDWGSAVAWRLAISHSKASDKMVIVNVPHPTAMEKFLYSSLTQIRKSWYIFWYQLPYIPEWSSSRNDFAKFKWLFSGSTHRKTFSGDCVPFYVEHWSKSLSTMMNWYRAVLRYPHPQAKSPYNQTVSTPTLIIWGEKDIALELQMAKDSLQYTSDGRLEIFTDASHWVTHDEPKKLASLMNEFFQ